MRDGRATTRIRMRRGAVALAGGGVALAALLSAPLALGQTTTAPAPTAVATSAPAATATTRRAEPTLPPGAVVVATPTPAGAASASATAASADAPTVAAPSVTAVATATIAVEGFRSTTAQLGDIVWARRVDPETGAPESRATALITTDAAIYAAIPVQRIATGVTISARWSYDGQSVAALTTELTTIADARPGWLVFQIVLPEGQIWPIGGYVIDVYVDNQFALTSSVIVSVPPPS
jgi:hypothetical protein